MSEDLDNYLKYSPYDAALFGKEGVERNAIFEKFSALSESILHFMTSPETASALEALVRQGTIPSNFAIAVGKIIFMVCTKEVPVTKIPELLTKLGLPEAQASSIAAALSTLLGPVIRERAAEAAPAMRQMPALTRPTESGPQPIAGQRNASKNIVDLRKQA